jgi:hypothetical protein
MIRQVADAAGYLWLESGVRPVVKEMCVRGIDSMVTERKLTGQLHSLRL